MKSLLFLFAFCPMLVMAQTGNISGRVVDEKNQALPFSTVYINQTTIGTVTDVDGKFILKNLPVGENDLIVSFVGYEPFQTPVSVKAGETSHISISLSPSTVSLKEVEVRSKRDAEWERRFGRFKEVFFGKTANADLCKIANPWVLEFREDPTLGLIADASAPLEIENLSLGYKLSYTLLKFATVDGAFTIYGLVQFKEMETTDKKLASVWSTRRKQAYYGSPRHLFKSIIGGRVEQEGFQLFTDISNSNEIVRDPNFIVNMNASIVNYNLQGNVMPVLSTASFMVRFPDRIEAHYRKKTAAPTVYRDVTRPVSWLEVEGGTLYVSKQGVPLNAAKLTVLGSMTELRVAEILPYDYDPGDGPVTANDELRKENSSAALVSLIEKPYLHLDRPYYYPNDVMRFKAYMNYGDPLLRDSLSHVLYVDLLDTQGQVRQTKAFPVFDGIASGDLTLGDEAPEGDYVLRASTKWMLNYGSAFVFQKPLKVVAYNQLARMYERPVPAPQGVDIVAEKDEFRVREKITLKFGAFDMLGMPRAANLSVSVTDIEQSYPPSKEMQIVETYPLTKADSAAAVGAKRTHPIESGFRVSGTFVGSSKKDKIAVIRLFQSATDLPLVLMTDDEGRFSSVLQLMDSMDLYVEAFTQKKKPGKVVLDSVPNPRPPFKPIAPLDMEFVRPEDQTRIHRQDPSSNVRVLEGITIVGKKINHAPKIQRDVQGSIKFDKEYMNVMIASDALSAIQRRLPGLRIIYQTGPDGMPIKYIVFTGNLSFHNVPQEPLLVIDGVPVADDANESIAMKLQRMPVRDIETVEVMKYGSASIYGTRAANGVIMITTSTGPSDLGKPEHHDLTLMQRLELPGYAATTPFDSPDYSKAAAGEQFDSRTTIYWDPAIVSNDKEPYVVTFYAADIPTTYRIVVEGVTADGTPVRAEKLVKVLE